MDNKIDFKEEFLIPVEAKDCQLIFEWANDEELRNNSFHTEKIAYHTHEKWFQQMLQDENSDMFLFVSGEQPIGQVRVVYQGKEALINYSIAKEFRGMGHGKQMLLLLEKELIGKASVLVAWVKRENKASRSVFVRLGYTLLREEEKGMLYKKNLLLE